VAAFLLSPLVLVCWAGGCALLRFTGWPRWRLAAAAVASGVLVVWIQGSPVPAVAAHFSGYLGLLSQFGHPMVHLPAPGAFLVPQVALSVPGPPGCLPDPRRELAVPDPAAQVREQRRQVKLERKARGIAARTVTPIGDTHAPLGVSLGRRRPLGQRPENCTAVSGARAGAIDVMERGRSFGVLSILSGQSYASLGNPEEADRITSVANTIALFASNTPEELARLAGSVQTAEAVLQAEDGRWTGKASITTRARHRVDPNTVRQLAPGQCVLVSGGRAEQLQVIRLPAQPRDPRPLHPAAKALSAVRVATRRPPAALARVGVPGLSQRVSWAGGTPATGEGVRRSSSPDG
jgi:hypothetical protein